MKTRRILITLFLVLSFVLAACTSATPTATPVPPKPVEPTKAPAVVPTTAPTAAPTQAPTAAPTLAPTKPATKYPEKPITLVVHAAAGGGSDIMARTFAAAYEKNKLLPQPVIVENRAGSSGAIAYAYVAGKKGDPYFLLTATGSYFTTPLQNPGSPTYKDFTAIANLAFDEFVVFVNPTSKYQSIKAIIDAAKASPKSVSFGGTQAGAADSICGYLIEKAAGVKFNNIVFNSGGEVNTAVMGGHVDFGIGNPGEILALEQAGKLKSLGVFADKRLAKAPNLLTMKEQGVDAVFQQNRGLVAPGGIPEDARKVLEDSIKKYMQTEEWKKYVSDNSLSEAFMDGPTYLAWEEKESARYASILKDQGVIK